MPKALGIFLLAIELPAFAQSEGKHTLAVSGQLDRNWQKDQVFSRVPRKSILWGGELAYAYHTDKRLFALTLQASRGRFTTFTETMNEGTQYAGSGAFQAMFLVKSTHRWQYWGGGAITFDFDFLLPDNALRYGWDALLSVGPSFQVRYVGLPKLQVHYETHVNLVGTLWRPNAQGFSLRTEEILETRGVLPAVFENPRFSSWHNTLKWSHRISASYPLSDRAMLTAAFRVQYVTIAVPRRKTGLTNGLNLGMRWNLNH